MSTVDWGPGDAGRPRVFCRTCGEVEYVDRPSGRGFPPDVARRRLARRHGDCRGSIEYRAGVGASLRRLIEQADAEPERAP